MNLSNEWNNFKLKYSKEYQNDSELVRRNLFEQNLNEVRLHQARFDNGEVQYEIGVNHLSDWQEDELNVLRGFRADLIQDSQDETTWLPVASAVDVPEKFDWRWYGMVQHVKNQGMCGSCWAFAAVGALETQLCRKTKHLYDLSEQQLVDCSGAYGNHACNGGLYDRAYQYIKSAPGITTQDKYPYVSGKTGRANNYCAYNNSTRVGTCTGHVRLPSKNIKALKYALATVGPVAVAINTRGPNFMHYKSGIYNPSYVPGDIQYLDHAVLCVGYGSENGVDYWIIKNSWGESWGEKGYVRIARDNRNICGVATYPCYPLV